MSGGNVPTDEKRSHVKAGFGSIHLQKKFKDLEQLLVTFRVMEIANSDDF